MLTAFTAQSIVEHKQRDKSKIESILAFGDKILVGLNTGCLRIYRLNEEPELVSDILPESVSDKDAKNGSKNDSQNDTKNDTKNDVIIPKAIDLLREEEKFSKKSILQLAIIKEAGLLLSLSDTYVSIHQLQTYELHERLEKTKGATLFAVTSNISREEDTAIASIVSKLAVAVKRKILLWSWHDSELMENVVEITLVAAAKSLTWATATKIIAGLDSGFVMIDVETLEVSDITKPGNLDDAGAKFGAVHSTGMGYVGIGSWVPKPMATKLTQDELLLAKDVHTLFINNKGSAINRREISWATVPESIGYSYPYLLALQAPAKGVLEIRNPKTLSLLQSIPVPNAVFFHVPQPNISLAHAGKGFLVASDRCIWRMNALKYESQIEDLTSQGLFDEAISLIDMLEDTLLLDKDIRLRDIKMMKAQALFDQRRYRDSLELFGDASAPPRKVIPLYPRSIAGVLSVYDDPDLVDESESKKSPPNSPRATPRKTMIGSLRARADSKKQDSDAASIKTVDTRDTRIHDGPMEGRELLVATNELCAFLAQTRVKLQKIIERDGTLKGPLPPVLPGSPWPEFRKLIALDQEDDNVDVDWHSKILEVATLVDTTLFRAYMLTKPTLAGSLFRLDNFCDSQVVRDKLYETGRYGDLIDFLHGKKLHREALEMLQRFGKDEKNESINPGLRGSRRTVSYLQQLPPEQISLILEFAEWPLRKDPDNGMEIFTVDTENAETLPRGQVLDFLENIQSQLAIRYLEHIIVELDDKTPDYHQRLIDLYLEKMKIGRESRPEYGGFETPEQKNTLKHNLEAILKNSSQYNKLRVFEKLPADDPDFYESRAIVLSQLGQHNKALQIYVFQLNDHQKAEEYCNKVYLAESENGSVSPTSSNFQQQTTNVIPDQTEVKSVYHTLLAIYLSPPAPHEPQLEPALNLLSNHGPRLPASQALALIPGTLSVETLESYFRGRMRAVAAQRNQERMVAALRVVEAGRVEEKLRNAMGGHIVVTEERLCPVCSKRVGTGAIRVEEKGGRVMHYGCWARRRKEGGDMKDRAEDVKGAMDRQRRRW